MATITPTAPTAPTDAPAPTQAITAKDLFALRFVGEVQLSPDGTQVAYTVTQADGETNRNRTAIWLASADGDTPPRQLTSGEKRDTAPRFSPDGTKLAFVSDRGKKAQVYLLDLTGGGEAMPLTHDDEHGASAPVWSPDGSQIAYLCKVASVPKPEDAAEYKDDTDKPRVITRGRYKFDGQGFFDETRNQLFVVPTTGGEPRQLTTGEVGVGSPAWSPDGTRIAVVSNREAGAETEPASDIWLVAVNDGALTRLSPHGQYSDPAWSPDGSQVAFTGHPYPTRGGTGSKLYVVPATGGEPRQVTKWDRNIGGGVMSDTGANGRSTPVWVGDQLYVLAPEKGTAQVWRIPATGGDPTQVTFGTHAIAGWDITADGGTLAYGASKVTSPGELFVQPLNRPGEPTIQLTHLTEQTLGGIDVPDAQEFWLTAGDGTGEMIQGWILKPPGFDASKKYPLLLEIHGGPAGTYGVGFFHEFQFFAAQGYVVVYCNPRGSQGYGDVFCTSIYQDWGTKPLMDVLAAVDYAVSKGYVDESRMYVTGGSYGGYMTNWVVTHSDRFRAGATQRCVSNLASFSLVSDIGRHFTRDYMGGQLWEVPEVLTRNSPITYITQCKTPLFIEHEEEDHRCPMEQSEQVYNALTALGVPTELVRYPKESHGMSRDGGPQHRVDRLTRIAGWFKRFA